MLFDEFQNIAPKIAKEVTSFEESHVKMMPSNRVELLKKMDYKSISPNKAAVLMLFYPKNNNTHLILIKRASYNGVHSSQIAFPGGKPEHEDVDLMQTALRETHEEIGVHPNKIEIIRPFSEVYIPPSNYMVFPFMGISKVELDFRIQEEEVESVVELPLNVFLDDSIITHKTMTTSYANDIMVPGFLVDNNFIWGATAMMLSELKDTIKKVF